MKCADILIILFIFATLQEIAAKFHTKGEISAGGKVAVNKKLSVEENIAAAASGSSNFSSDNISSISEFGSNSNPDNSSSDSNSNPDSTSEFKIPSSSSDSPSESKIPSSSSDSPSESKIPSSSSDSPSESKIPSSSSDSPSESKIPSSSSDSPSESKISSSSSNSNPDSSSESKIPSSSSDSPSESKIPSSSSDSPSESKIPSSSSDSPSESKIPSSSSDSPSESKIPSSSSDSSSDSNSISSSSSEICTEGLNVKLKFPNVPLEEFLVTVGEGILTIKDALKAIEVRVELIGFASSKLALQAVIRAEAELKNKTFATPDELEAALVKVSAELEEALKQVVDLVVEADNNSAIKANVQLIKEITTSLINSINVIKVSVDCPCAAFLSGTTVALAETTTTAKPKMSALRRLQQQSFISEDKSVF